MDKLITKENLKLIGLKEWTHPKKQDDVRLYFNIERYLDKLDGYLMSKKKDYMIKRSKIFFDKNLKLVIVAHQDDRDQYLNKRLVTEAVKDFIEMLIEEELDKETNK